MNSYHRVVFFGLIVPTPHIRHVLQHEVQAG